jgi:hypothetical protein
MKIRYAFTRQDLTRAVTDPIEVGDVHLHLSEILADKATGPAEAYGLTLEVAQPSDPTPV